MFACISDVFPPGFVVVNADSPGIKIGRVNINKISYFGNKLPKVTLKRGIPGRFIAKRALGVGLPHIQIGPVKQRRETAVDVCSHSIQPPIFLVSEENFLSRPALKKVSKASPIV